MMLWAEFLKGKHFISGSEFVAETPQLTASGEWLLIGERGQRATQTLSLQFGHVFSKGYGWSVDEKPIIKPPFLLSHCHEVRMVFSAEVDFEINQDRDVRNQWPQWTSWDYLVNGGDDWFGILRWWVSGIFRKRDRWWLHAFAREDVEVGSSALYNTSPEDCPELGRLSVRSEQRR